VKTKSIDYDRWSGERLGVWSRSWVITTAGLRQLMGYKFFKILLFIGWTGGMAVAAAGFLFAQTMAEGGWLADMAVKAGPRAEAVMQAITALLLVFPDLLVTTAFKGIFWGHSELGLVLNLAAMALLVPQLITRDRASHALTIYLARPITARDYLVGKLGVIVGVLLLLWTGPLVFGWLLAMVLSPNSLFFSYSLDALGVALLFNLIAMVVIAGMALGVSALAKTAARARLAWIGLWIVLSAVAAHAKVLPGWIRHLSFVSDLRIVRDEVFGMQDAMMDAADIVPMINPRLAEQITEVAVRLDTSEITGVAVMLTLMVGAALWMVRGRIKPE
jgi:ABC-2 type transport system permease protein